MVILHSYSCEKSLKSVSTSTHERAKELLTQLAELLKECYKFMREVVVPI
jgi:hypothetical protein